MERQRHREYLIRLPGRMADAIDHLAAVTKQPKSALLGMLIQAGLTTLVAHRQVKTARQWRGLIVEYRARQQSSK